MKWMLGVAVALLLAIYGVVENIPVQAQQRPYALYPIHSKALGSFSHCLVVTLQGYAVVLEYPCPE